MMPLQSNQGSGHGTNMCRFLPIGEALAPSGLHRACWWTFLSRTEDTCLLAHQPPWGRCTGVTMPLSKRGLITGDHVGVCGGMLSALKTLLSHPMPLPTEPRGARCLPSGCLFWPCLLARCSLGAVCSPLAYALQLCEQGPCLLACRASAFRTFAQCPATHKGRLIN